MAGIARLPLLFAVETELKGLAGLGVHLGEIPSKLPIKQTSGSPDASGRVAPYVVVYASPGTPTRAGRDLADTHQDLDWIIQLIVGAGYLEDLLHTVDRIDEQLHGWSPTIDGVAFSGLRPPDGYDSGPSRRNDSVDPPRHWLPMQYRLLATR